jgi:Mrp family chromosome partitioning ATPase
VDDGSTVYDPQRLSCGRERCFFVLSAERGLSILLQLTIAARETDYIRRLAEYIRESPYGRDWRMTGISSAAALKQYLIGGHAIDLLLIQPWLLQEAEAHGAGIPKALLVRRPGETQGLANAEGLTEVLQYQSMPRLFRQLSEVRGEWGGSIVRLGRGHANRAAILGVYSASGGIGVTTTALHLAHLASLRERNVFYLNLEPYDATGALLGDTRSEGLSRLLYAFNSKPEEAAVLLKRLRKHHPVLKADYLPGDCPPEERIALGRFEVGQLLDTITDSGDYDTVIVDLGSGMTEAHGEVLRRCAAMLWLAGCDAGARFKSDAALGYARRTWQDDAAGWERKLRYVECGIEEGMDARGTRDAAVRRSAVFGQLPRASGMRYGDDLRRLLDLPPYRSAVSRLLDKLELGGGDADDIGADGLAASRAR